MTPKTAGRIAFVLLASVAAIISLDAYNRVGMSSQPVVHTPTAFERCAAEFQRANLSVEAYCGQLRETEG